VPSRAGSPHAGPAYSKPMIAPRMPLEVLSLPGVVVPVGVGDAGGVVGGVELGVGALVGGGEVCLVFEGVAEDEWLAGVDGSSDVPNCPDVPVLGV
jgi:hypothetical protein